MGFRPSAIRRPNRQWWGRIDDPVLAICPVFHLEEVPASILERGPRPLLCAGYGCRKAMARCDDPDLIAAYRLGGVEAVDHLLWHPPQERP